MPRRVPAALLGLILASPALAQDPAPVIAPPTEAPPAAAPRLGADFDAAARSPEAIGKGKAALAAAAKAYKSAPTITDRLSFKESSPMGEQTLSLDFRFGKGTDAQIRIGDNIRTALGDSVSVVSEFPEDRYLRIPLDGNLADTLAAAIGQQFPIPQFTLRYGDESETSEAMPYDFLVLSRPAIAGFREVDGSPIVLLTCPEGEATVRLDAKNSLVSAARVHFRPQQAPEDFLVKWEMDFSPKVADELVPPISVEAGTRVAVGSVEEMLPQPLQVGDPAPTFNLKDLEGKEVSLESLRGSVVVLDFWATWCPPCRRGLPFINEFATWAAGSGKPVKVFAINTLENGDAAERTRKAADWWKENKMGFPCLMDVDDKAFKPYGLDGIPVTAVIGPDGVIRVLHLGLSDPPGSIVDSLKAAVLEALGEQSPPVP